jgi:hypothetical protein
MTPEAPGPRPPAIQSPLTLVMRIKDGHYEHIEALLHRIQAAPPDKNPIWRALDKLKTAHFARFVFLDKAKLAVITTYDGSFDTYINEFIDEIGDVFNAVLQHMDGAPPVPVQQHRQAFLDYVRANDLRGLEPFYSAYPTASVVTILAALEDQV